MAKTAEPKFKMGQIVYLECDPDQVKHMILGISITPNGYQYSIRIDGSIVDYYDIELSENKNVI